MKGPGHTDDEYQKALERMRVLHDTYPDFVPVLNTLGAAYYRVGRHKEAVDYLNRSLHSRKSESADLDPADLGFLAMAQHRLGFTEAARQTLAELQQIMRFRAGIDYEETLLKEAETLIGGAQTDQLRQPTLEPN